MIAATPRDSAASASGDRPPVLRFGEFTLDRVVGELRRRGEPVKIPPQPTRALQHLVENAGRLVTRRELQEVLWGDGRHVDFEQGLNYCIRQVREALGDSTEVSRHIVTVPRRGYRFVASTQELAAGATRPGASRRLRRWWVPATLALVLFAAASWVTLRGGGATPPGPARVQRLAIAPFAAPAPEDATVARVLFEELRVVLERRAPGLQLVAADAAEVNLELDGTVYRRGEELTLSLRLLRRADGAAVWSTTFRQPLGASDWLDWPQRAVDELATVLAP